MHRTIQPYVTYALSLRTAELLVACQVYRTASAPPELESNLHDLFAGVRYPAVTLILHRNVLEINSQTNNSKLSRRGASNHAAKSMLYGYGV